MSKIKFNFPAVVTSKPFSGLAVGSQPNEEAGPEGCVGGRHTAERRGCGRICPGHGPQGGGRVRVLLCINPQGHNQGDRLERS